MLYRVKELAHVVYDPDLLDVGEYIDAVLLLVTQATFMASGVKKLKKHDVKDAAELLRQEGVLQLLDSLEDGRTRYMKSLATVNTLKEKVQDKHINADTAGALAKLLAVGPKSPGLGLRSNQ